MSRAHRTQSYGVPRFFRQRRAGGSLLVAMALCVAAPVFAQQAASDDPPAPGSGGADQQVGVQMGPHLFDLTHAPRRIEFQRMVRGLPMVYITDNMDAADSVSSDECWPGGSTGFNLDGAGVTLGVWDGGAVMTNHDELNGRAFQQDSPSSYHWHSSHVAGTMAGIGAWGGNVDWPAGWSKGSSYSCTLYCWDWNSDETEMDNAAAAGLRVSSHSYGYISGWYNDGSNWYWYGDLGVDSNEDFYFGFYSFQAVEWDQIAWDNPYFLICKSAGNDRNDDGPGAGGGHYHYDGGWVWATDSHDPDGQYDCIAHAAIGKNLLAVGAVDDVVGGYSGAGSVVQSSFSAWGPADDGRVKPDICGNGVNLLSAYWYSGDPSGTSYYAVSSGTSMSTPNVSGSLGLLIQQWRATHPSEDDMLSSALKGLVLHTADECGSADGPDYQFGWGLMNTATAASVIAEDVLEPLTISSDVLTNGGTAELFATTDGSSELKATLCWTDVPGSEPSPSLDPATPALVNDLDLRIELNGSPAQTHYPWKLNRNNPTAAATTGDNTVDNVEMISVPSPGAGTHTIRISHKGSLVGGSQTYSLIITGATSISDTGGCPMTNPPTADAAGPYVIDLGDSVLLDGSASSDPDGACGDYVARYEWDLNNDGTYDLDSNDPTPTVSWATLAGLSPSLSYPADPGSGLPNNTITLRVSDSVGTTDTTTTTLTIYDNSPTACFTASPNPAACEQSVTFDASCSSHGSPSHTIVAYDWDLDNDGQYDDASGVSIAHAFPAFGDYTVGLRVTDDNVPPNTDTTSTIVSVDQGNSAPTANHGGPYEMDAGDSIQLQGSGSDPDAACGDSIVSYAWDIDNDGQYDDAGGATPTLTWGQITSLGLTAPGSNPIALRVTDSFGLTDNASTTLTIYDNTPTACFTANPNPAACNQSVTFDASCSSHGSPLHGIVLYEWDLDNDGQYDDATGVTVNHAFPAFGDHTVGLRVTDDNSTPLTDTDSTLVTVDQGNSVPSAAHGGPYAMDIGDNIQLDASGSSDPDTACGDSIVSYAWDIDNDGQYDDATGETPLLTWSQIQSLGLTAPGSNTIGLQVTDGFGATDTDSTTLNIYDNQPVACFTAAPNPAACEQSITFDASCSTHGNPSHSIVLYEWDLDNDGQYDDATGVSITHAFSAFGGYTVGLRVTDDNAVPLTDTDSTVVSVNQGNSAPVADDGGPYVIDQGAGVSLNASASSDPDTACGDSIVSYAWDLDNDGQFDDATGATPSLSWGQLTALGLAYPADPGSGLPTNTISVRVTDSFGVPDTSSTTLTIYDNTPTACFTASPNPAACEQSITFDASCSTHGSPAHGIVQYEWDFDGDLIVDETTPNPITTHAYPQFGTYSVTLTVTDDNVPAKTDSTGTTVNVDQGNNPPIADAGGPYEIVEGEDVLLDGGVSSDPDTNCGDEIVSYEWDLNGDGVFDVTGPTPLVSWATLDSLTPPLVYPASRSTGLPANEVSLRVTDTFGATHTAATTLVIYAPCPSDLDGNGAIDLTDLGLLLGDYGSPCGSCIGDLTGDGNVDLTDLGMLLGDYGPCP